MKRAFPILLLASLTGCFESSTEPVASANSVPVPPALTPSLASPCPPLNQLPDQSVGTLVLEDSDAAQKYSACQNKHAEVAGLYELWRQRVIEFKASITK